MRLLVVMLFALIPLSAVADYNVGRDAANRGDFATALEEWLPLAKAGDKESQFGIGRMYARGDGVQKNFEAARTWLERASSQGHARAATLLGKLYENGDGGTSDSVKAESYFRQAHALGDAEGPNLIERVSAAIPSNSLNAAAVSEARKEEPKNYGVKMYSALKGLEATMTKDQEFNEYYLACREGPITGEMRAAVASSGKRDPDVKKGLEIMEMTTCLCLSYELKNAELRGYMKRGVMNILEGERTAEFYGTQKGQQLGMVFMPVNMRCSQRGENGSEFYQTLDGSIN